MLVIRILAGQLTGALLKAKPRSSTRNGRPVIVSLEYRVESGSLAIIEANNAAFATSIDAEGDLIGAVQLDGRPLYKYAATWPPETRLELSADADHLVVKGTGSTIRLPRTDAGGKSPIIRAPMPPNKKHKGKVEVPPDPVGKREALSDTWDFSARVPMPGHRVGRKDP
jgi:hypothetical protein